VILSDSVRDSVCPHDKTKTGETKIAKLGTEIPHPPVNIRSKGQRSRSQGQKVQKVAMRQPRGAVSLLYDATQRDGASRLSSAKPLVYSFFFYCLFLFGSCGRLTNWLPASFQRTLSIFCLIDWYATKRADFIKL